MKDARTGWSVVKWRCVARALFAIGLLGALVSSAQAGTWTWTGQGSDDNWSTPENWSPASLPTRDEMTVVIFDGTCRLTPDQDVYDEYRFGGIVFTNTAGVFVLSGTTNIASSEGYKRWQFSGPTNMPYIRVLTTNPVAFAGPVVAVDKKTGVPVVTSVVDVTENGVLSLPIIYGVKSNVVTKRGAGLVRVCETNDGIRYAYNNKSTGPEWRVEDGVVEMGVRTNRLLFATGDTKGTNWVLATAHVKCSYNLTVGDGVGGATSAIFRLIGPSEKNVLDNTLAIAVNADGLLDFNGVQDWCDNTENDTLKLSISNGLVRLGGSSLHVYKAQTLNLRGSARIEGNKTNSFVFYDGATIDVDGCNTTAVLLADADLHMVSGSPSGVVFHVSGHTGDVAALEVTGHLGAGGAGSHLVKRGAGTMVMGNLTHAVRTNRVEQGSLQINGLSRCCATASGSQWLVLTNATLGGSGTISNASVVVQGGTLDPGGVAIGTLTIASNVTLTAGATLVFALARVEPGMGHTNDQLVIQNGILTGLSNAALRIEAPDRPDVDGQSFRIIRGGGNLTGLAVRAVTFAGRTGRRAVVTTGDGFVDVNIRNTLTATVLIVR